MSDRDHRMLVHRPGAVVVMLTIAMGAAGAPDPLIEGNRLLRAGDAAAALKAYGAPGPDDSARLRLARALATLQAARSLGDASPNALDEAQGLLEALIADGSTDADVLTSSHIALGAALLSRAEAASHADRPGAVELFRQAASSYLAASRIDPTILDAARNVEHARRRMADLLRDLGQNPPTPQEQQAQRQREQSRQGHDQSQGQSQSQSSPDASGSQQQEADERRSRAEQLSERLGDLAHHQQREAEESAARRQDDQASAQQRDLSEQTRQSLDDLQQQIDQFTQGDEGSDDTPSPSEQGQGTPRSWLDQARGSLEQARRAQEQAQRALDEQRADDAAQAQQQAADHLAQAARSVSEAAEQMVPQEESLQQQDATQSPESESQSQNQSQEQSANPPPGDARPAGDPLVERLLDRERRQREQRSISRPGRPVRVDRDW